MDLDGKVVLITGAGKGAGRSLGLEFAAHGAYVAANDVSPVNLDALVAAGGGRVRAYPEDIAKKVGVQAVLKQVEDDFGRLDIVVNHAAVDPPDSLLEIDEWDWHRVLDVNLTGAFLTIQSAGRIMRAAGSGHIINLVHLESPGHAPQTATMYALIALTTVAASELGPHGIFVHAVGRGISVFHNADASVPHELGAAVLYLCTSPLNGQVVNVEAS